MILEHVSRLKELVKLGVLSVIEKQEKDQHALSVILSKLPVEPCPVPLIVDG